MGLECGCYNFVFTVMLIPSGIRNKFCTADQLCVNNIFKDQ